MPKYLLLMIAFLVYPAISFGQTYTYTSTPSADGSIKTWSPSGAVHYTRVDDAVGCNGNVDYINTNTVGKKETFKIPLISNAIFIKEIHIYPCASNNLSGVATSSTLKVFYKVNGQTSAESDPYVLLGTTPVFLGVKSFTNLSVPYGAGSTIEVGVSLDSGTRGVRLSRIAATIVYEELEKVTNVSAESVPSIQNIIRWVDGSTKEDGYRVYKSTSTQAGPFLQIASTTPNATEYIDTNVAPDVNAYYLVRTYHSAGVSGYTYGGLDDPNDSITHAVSAVSLPNAPSNLIGQASSTPFSSVVLDWLDNSSNEQGFKVERSYDGVNFVEIATPSINTKTYRDVPPANGTWHYRVRAFNSIGSSSYSNAISVVF